MPTNVRTHKFRGHVWRLGRVRSVGERGGCEGPHVPGKEIDIPVNGGRLTDLDTCIHEALHACFWDMAEEAVSEAASDIARLLWRLNWRKVNDGQ